MFQCSSASRKFLNSAPSRRVLLKLAGFSALQRAENSSIETVVQLLVKELEVSVLFSEPKIPQLIPLETDVVLITVSVLFSEPKIPQFITASPAVRTKPSFSALQRAENSSIERRRTAPPASCTFQCSSASRKFLNCMFGRETHRPKWFQCSSASRKFLN